MSACADNIAVPGSHCFLRRVIFREFYRGNRMKSIGIKLADGTFYPLLEEGNPEKKTIDLTTVMDNQTKVQVGVYRTETGSLEGAEYIDTLEITNLNPHQNGEPTLCLAIDMDENNGLSAEIRDTETGRTSEFQVTLASRTLSEANAAQPLPEPENDSSVTISDSDLENAGLEDFVDADTDSAGSDNSDEFPFDDVNKTITQEPQETEPSAENPPADKAIFGEDSLELPDLSSVQEPEPDVNDTELTDADFDLPDESTDTDSVPAVEAADTAETAAEPVPPQEADEDFSLPDLSSLEADFPETQPDAPAEDSLSSLSDFSINDEETPADDFSALTEESGANKTEGTDFTADLPDFDDTEFDSGTDNFDLPDFDDEKTGTELLSDDDDFSLPPDFGETEPQKDPTFQPNTNMFSNLYDKETMQGSSSSYTEEDDDIRKKTKVPVAICIICAIICIIAALLVLFVIPSRLNIFTKTEITETAEETADSSSLGQSQESEPAETEQLTELPPVAAQEDIIVVAETPESVVPEPPAPPPVPPADIRYKIVWGDTLWDISNAYYKTPWKYKRIANYNGIKNPDHIISGRWILIPAE